MLSFILVSFFMLCVQCILVYANPIPVYPDPKPTFMPSIPLSTVQDSGFIVWLFLVWFLDIAVNTLLLYAGFLLLIRFQMESEEWFTTISRIRMVAGILILSIAGIVSEWLIGFWISGLVLVAGIVFITTYELGIHFFELNPRSSLVLSVFLVVLNAISWTVIFML